MKSVCAGICLIEITSHPSRGAWIEIVPDDWMPKYPNVAPLTGCVD